jgi:hypothetical protein
MMSEFFAAAALIGVAYYVHRYSKRGTTQVMAITDDTGGPAVRGDDNDYEEPVPQKTAQKITLKQATIGAAQIPQFVRV